MLRRKKTDSRSITYWILSITVRQDGGTLQKVSIEDGGPSVRGEKSSRLKEEPFSEKRGKSISHQAWFRGALKRKGNRFRAKEGSTERG